MTRAWGAALAAAVAVLSEVTPAAAEVSAPAPPSMLDHIHVTLEYHGAPGCKEGEVFQHALSFHLYRWDVWALPAPWRLVLTITPNGDGFAGDAVLWDPAKTVRWGRHVDGPVSCVKVLEIVALALGLALDPSPVAPANGPAAPPPPAPAAVSKPEPPTPQELPPPDPPPPPPPPKVLVVPRFGASVWGEYATIPSFGVRLGENIRLPFWRHLYLEPGIDLLRAFGPNLLTQAGARPVPRFKVDVGLGLLIELGSP